MTFDGPKGKYVTDIWEGGVERAGWTVRRRTKKIMRYSLHEREMEISKRGRGKTPDQPSPAAMVNGA